MVAMSVDGGYKPRGNLAFEPYAVMVKRLGLPDARNKGPLSLIPEAENEAHQKRQAAYWKAIRDEEEAKKVHTCDDWTYDPDEESPAVWCPACRHAEWLRHSRAGQQLIVDAYMAEHYPQPMKPVDEKKPILTRVTVFMKAMLEIGDATSLMLRDSLINNMRPWSYYCDKEDKEWSTRVLAPVIRNEPTLSMEKYMAIQEKLHGPSKRKAPREEAYVPSVAAQSAASVESSFFNRTKAAPAEPSFFNRVQKPVAEAAGAEAAGAEVAALAPPAVLGGDEEKRMAAFAAWDAQDRETARKPYHNGRMVAGNCRRPKREVSDAHKVVLRNLPLGIDSLKADMWELVAQAAPVTFLEAPKGIFITLATPRDVDAVLARWPNGVNYMGNVITFQRAGVARR
jgi:hypothetical protein